MESCPLLISSSISSAPSRQCFSVYNDVQFTLGISTCFERIHFVGSEVMRSVVVILLPTISLVFLILFKKCVREYCKQ